LITGPYGATSSTNYVTCGNGTGPDGSAAGSMVIYSLPAATYGHDLTNITVYGGWANNGRDQQAYTVYYATAAAPTNFILLTAVNYNPQVASGIQSATRVTITSAAGILASNVVALKFDFTNPASENGYCGYAGITVFGSASIAPAVPTVLNATLEAPGSLMMNIGNLVPGRNYTVQSTTNLVTAVWTPETNFVAAQLATAFTNSATNSRQKFYRVLGN
jgi:hypothetical protein